MTQPILIKDRSSQFFKIVLMGDAGCGKTSLSRYAHSKQICDSPYIPTIGFDFFMKEFDIQGVLVKLQIWDTTCSQRYRSITRTYYKGAVAIVIVFDITDRYAFDKARDTYIQEVRDCGPESMVTYLVGTKRDLLERREVDRETAEEEAERLGMRYFECSSMTGENVEEMFGEIAIECSRLNSLEVKQPSVIQTLKKRKQQLQDCGCSSRSHDHPKQKKRCF